VASVTPSPADSEQNTTLRCHICACIDKTVWRASGQSPQLVLVSQGITGVDKLRVSWMWAELSFLETRCRWPNATLPPQRGRITRFQGPSPLLLVNGCPKGYIFRQADGGGRMATRGGGCLASDAGRQASWAVTGGFLGSRDGETMLWRLLGTIAGCRCR